MKFKNNIIHIKVDQTTLPDKLHLDSQLRYKAQVFKPKKGKGSFKRNKRINIEE